MTFPSFTRTAATAKSVVLTVLPHGGQGAARRNAWSAMSADASRARARREASQVMDRAVERAARRVATN